MGSATSTTSLSHSVLVHILWVGNAVGERSLDARERRGCGEEDAERDEGGAGGYGEDVQGECEEVVELRGIHHTPWDARHVDVEHTEARRGG